MKKSRSQKQREIWYFETFIPQAEQDLTDARLAVARAEQRCRDALATLQRLRREKHQARY